MRAMHSVHTMKRCQRALQNEVDPGLRSRDEILFLMLHKRDSSNAPVAAQDTCSLYCTCPISTLLTHNSVRNADAVQCTRMHLRGGGFLVRACVARMCACANLAEMRCLARRHLNMGVPRVQQGKIGKSTERGSSRPAQCPLPLSLADARLSPLSQRNIGIDCQCGPIVCS